MCREGEGCEGDEGTRLHRNRYSSSPSKRTEIGRCGAHLLRPLVLLRIQNKDRTVTVPVASCGGEHVSPTSRAPDLYEYSAATRLMNVNSDEAPYFNAHAATRIICHTCVDM